MTLHSFNTRLKGWREAKEADRLEAWRQNRNLAGYVLAIGQWQKGKAPDIMKLMPLPGDPKNHAQLRAEESPAEAAHRRYKAKAIQGRRGKAMNFDPDIEKLIRQHYQPAWGPHPDELVKKRDEG
jgi:hypothetical protein